MYNLSIRTCYEYIYVLCIYQICMYVYNIIRIPYTIQIKCSDKYTIYINGERERVKNEMIIIGYD